VSEDHGLGRRMRGVVLWGAPLAPHTTLRIGGPAEVFAVPETEADLVAALAWAREAGRPWRVIGLGSNLLCPDEGFSGLVVTLARACSSWRLDGDRLWVGAGVHLAPLVARTARMGWAGLEGVAGVPGTVGGALAMNAGTPDGVMADLVRRVRVLLPDGRTCWWEPSDLAFSYRSSRLQEGDAVALEAELQLRRADPEALVRELRRRAARRRQVQPLELPNAGSVWRNPPGDYAGRLVEAAGCKGIRRGDAQVSAKHANFIVNVGRASARDVIALMAVVRAEVARRCGVRLHPEIRWLPGQDALEAALDRPPAAEG
jgi:UDP-N-acetylmuramate dehydrogenase